MAKKKSKRNSKNQKDQIFISYNERSSLQIARCFKERLKADFDNLINIFVASASEEDSLSLGECTLRGLEKELKKSKLLLALINSSSINNPWINFEAGSIWLRGSRVIPVCMHEVIFDELKPPLKLFTAMKLNSAGIVNLYKTIENDFQVKCNFKIDSEANQIEDFVSETKRLSELIIYRAHYGVKGSYSDVTDVLKSQNINNYLRAEANNIFLLGSDPNKNPAPRQEKFLEVFYRLGNEDMEIKVKEGEVLKLP